MSSLLSKPFIHIRKYIIAGLIVWVPLGITIFAIKLMVDLLDRSIILLPPSLRPEQLIGFPLPGLGIVISTAVILVTGLVVTNLAGRKMVNLGENILNRIPLVRSIYSAVKQVTQTLISTDNNSLRQVLLIQYPRKGIWTLAFQTGDSISSLNEMTGEKLLTVFVPTAPNPTSGVVILLPEKDVKKLDLDVEDALKFIMSLGVVTPGSKSRKYSEVVNLDLSELQKKPK